MAVTAWTSPALGQSIAKAGGAVHWTTPTNIYTSNNQYAYARIPWDSESHYLRATQFGFSIPAGATIDGLEARFERKAEIADAIEDMDLHLVYGGSQRGIDKAALMWSATEGYVTYGSPSDGWGASLTQAIVNHSSFGIQISVLNSYEEEEDWRAYVDHIQIRIYYTEVGTNIKINIADAWKEAAELKINIGDAWKPVVKVYENIGDAWKTIFG